jgi:hypothetical protein
MENTLLRKLLATADASAFIRDIQIYQNWILADSHRFALSTFFRTLPGLEEPADMRTYQGDLLGQSASAVVPGLVAARTALHRALGMACLSSMLPEPAGLFEGNAIDSFAALARTRRTVFIGHFHEGAAWREQGWPVDIVELFPQPGDIHWDDSRAVLQRAEIVLMTGLTLVNDTFREVIDRTPRAAIRAIMGPTVPCSPVFFEEGIDFVGATLVGDADLLARYCRLGGGSIKYAPPGALRKVNLTRRPELRAQIQRENATCG